MLPPVFSQSCGQDVDLVLQVMNLDPNFPPVTLQVLDLMCKLLYHLQSTMVMRRKKKDSWWTDFVYTVPTHLCIVVMFQLLISGTGNITSVTFQQINLKCNHINHWITVMQT